MGRRKILIAFVAFLGILLLGTYLVLRHTGAGRAIVESALAKLIRSRFDLGGAEVDPASGKVRLTDVDIGHPVLQEQSVLTAGGVELDVATNPLGADAVGSVRKVKIENLDLRLSLTEGEQWQLDQVVQLPAADAANSEGTYPAVIITGSRFSIRATADTPDVVFSEVELELLPGAVGQPAMVLNGSMRSPAGFPVTVSGSVEPASGEFQVLLEAQDVPLAPRTVAAYSPELEAYLAAAGFGGTAHKISVTLRNVADPDAGGDVEARVGIEVRDVACTPRELPYPITGAQGRVTASTRHDGKVQFELDAQAPGGTIHAGGELLGCFTGQPQLDVRVDAKSIAVDQQLADALAGLKVPRMVWQAFDPRGGRADASVHVYNEEAGGPPQVEMDLKLHEVSASFEGFPSRMGEPNVRFPYRLDGVTGDIQLRTDRVSVQNLTGKRADGGGITIRGEIRRIGRPPIEQEIELSISGRQLAFSDDLRAAVDALVHDGGKTYDGFAPRGRSDAEVTIRKQAGESPDAHVLLTPLGCSVSYHFFPYRLEDIRGEIDLQTRGLSFDLSGRRGEASIDIGGRFLLEPATYGLQSELWVSGRSIPLDRELREALARLGPELDDFWDEYRPRGTVDCHLTLWRPFDAEAFQHDLRVDFRDGAVAMPRWERELQRVTGTVFVHGSGADNRLDINVLRGFLDGGPQGPSDTSVLLQGSMHSSPDGRGIDLTTVIRDLTLDSRLARTLDRGGIMSLETWRVLAPSGQVDLVSRARVAGDGGGESQSLRMLLRGVRSDAKVLPSPATDMRGEVEIVDGVGSFTDIRGKMGSAEVVGTRGTFGRRDKSTFVSVALASDHMPVDASFANLVTGPLKKTFLERRVRGAVRVDNLVLDYEFPDEGDDFRLKLAGAITAKDLSMVIVVPVREIKGTWQIDDGEITPRGGEVRCRAEDVAFRLLGHPCRAFTANLEATPAAITLDDLSMRLHGGQVTGTGDEDRAAVRYALTEEGELSGVLAWEGISLSQLLRAAGQSSAARGTVAGGIDLERLRGTDLVDIAAAGSLQISNARLGEVPMFTAIYSYLEPKNRPQFTGASLEFTVRDRQVAVDDLRVMSRLINITGSGSVDLDGYMDIMLEFPSMFATAPEWLILPRVLHVLTNQVVNFQVFGYLRKPDAQPRWLFNGSPRRKRIYPIPSYLPPEPRPDF